MKTKSTIKIKNLTLFGTAILAGILSGLNPVSANPISATFTNDPRCDAPHPRVFTEELGTVPGFINNLDELISVTTSLTPDIACPTNAVAGGNNDWQVNMTNITQPPRSFTNLYFVSDALPVGNADGTVGGQDAFKIDKLGINQPLLSESLTTNGIFEPNETWSFLVSDFAQAPTFGSLGLASGDVASNANIVTVPEPTTILGTMMVLGFGGFLKKQKNKQNN